MPRTKEQNERRRSDRRHAILQVAITLFAEQGFLQTTTSQVAECAGVSHGTIFHYFPTKEALFRAAVLERAAAFEQQLAVIDIRERRPLERIKDLVATQILTAVQERSYLRLTQYVVSQPARFPDLAQELSDFVDRFCRRLAAVVEEGQQCGELASGGAFEIALCYFCYLNGVALIILGDEPSSPLWNDVIGNAVRIFGPREGVQP